GCSREFGNPSVGLDNCGAISFRASSNFISALEHNRRMPNGCTSRTRQLSSAAVRVSESLALETNAEDSEDRESFDFREPVWQGLPQSQQPVVASGEPPALQCRPHPAPPGTT
ncbi:hypothetical protein TNCV_53971, partial [Trichonephila clavipes]